ncbi:NPR2-domain-containing protein [Sporormia fimetaria CBS 119925]|uniref:NPR2-domain-containing protein n=1 Tax=Sporormia fimetaria CBS 119925 TaxID=1340428 RepID=A0A6A6VPM7_9PLEO|nr:NPR2-domain-containing protein [Sporormia fimetaria CBS 119925]
MPSRHIKAIFFARFHHEKGSRVLHQVPDGSITPSKDSAALPAPLFDFDSVSTYVIPTQQFCDRLLTICSNHHRIIGYPVCVREGKYSRNEYIFNFALVIDEDVKDWKPYGEVARKMGRLLRGLEEQAGFLSREEETVWDDGFKSTGSGSDSESKVYALCEVVLEDLNNYAECMYPIDDSNTINFKIFPTLPPPPPIHAYQVPVLTMSLDSLSSPISSDLTLNRILPHINGVRPVAHIWKLADTDPSLTRKALQHLAYYGCLVLLDVFQFGAIYAPTPLISAFVADESLQEQCTRYIHVPRPKFGSKSFASESEASHSQHSSQQNLKPAPMSDTNNITTNNLDPASSERDILSDTTTPNDDPDTTDKIDPMTLITLYTSLRPGQPLKLWVLEHFRQLHNIDIRRFITFGVLKGFLYRVQKYAISTNALSHDNVPPAPPASLEDGDEDVGSSAAVKNLDVGGRKVDRVDGGMVEGRYMGSSTGPPATTGRSTAQERLREIQRASMGVGVATKSSHSTQTAMSLRSTTTATTTTTENPPTRASEDTRTPTIPGMPSKQPAAAAVKRQMEERREIASALPLIRFLDGVHCFDEICAEVGVSERVVEEKVRRAAGDVWVFWK